MPSSSVLVLDANILIRAVLGNKVKQILITYNDVVDFFTPDICIADADEAYSKVKANTSAFCITF